MDTLIKIIAGIGLLLIGAVLGAAYTLTEMRKFDDEMNDRETQKNP